MKNKKYSRLNYFIPVGILLCVFLISFKTSAQSLTFVQSSKTAKLFEYDRSAALDLKEESSREQDGISIRDVSFASYSSPDKRVKAYIISPRGKGDFAGVIFFHWYGRPNGNRNQFVDEAVALAKQGTVSLLIQGYFPWAQDPTDAVADRQRVIDQTIDVRRSLDLLLSQPGVNAKRVAFVGHDYGAMYGSILASVDKRVKNYNLIAGIGSFSDWSLRYWLAKDSDGSKEAYRKSLSEVDPMTHIARAKSAKLFFQFANQDEHITKAEAESFFNAAGKTKQIKWYDGKHELNVEAARRDRRAWLTRQLKLVKP
jgi:dienelactone hydrolase